MYNSDATTKIIRTVVGSDRYVGFAPAGTALDAIGWSIAKEVNFAATTNQVLWAKATTGDRRNLVFNDYATYTYD